MRLSARLSQIAVSEDGVVAITIADFVGCSLGDVISERAVEIAQKVGVVRQYDQLATPSRELC
jgi:hypothetical protein